MPKTTATKANFSVVKSSKKLAQKAPQSLIDQAVRVYEDRQHPGTKKSKTRAEINITKKKIYRQKGTGNARHGAASAPIFVGGGTAHGPKSVKRELTLPQAMRKKALFGVMQQKIEAGKVVSVDNLGGFTKTKEAAQIVKEIKKEIKSTGQTLFVIPKESKAAKAVRNIQNCEVLNITNLNAYSVYRSSLIILDGSLV